MYTFTLCQVRHNVSISVGVSVTISNAIFSCRMYESNDSGHTIQRHDAPTNATNTSWTMEAKHFPDHICGISLSRQSASLHIVLIRPFPWPLEQPGETYKVNRFISPGRSSLRSNTLCLCNLMPSDSRNLEQLDTPLDWCNTDPSPTYTMSRRVTQTSNTISPEISTRVDMDTILATVDPEIEATQTNFTFEKASIPEDEVPLCVTQFPQAANKSSLPAEVVIGLMNEIPRWVRGSVINFAAYSGGYPKAEDAVYAAQQLNRAALFWNSKRVGVTFRWASFTQSTIDMNTSPLIISTGQKRLRRRLRPRLRPRRQPRPNRTRLLPQQHRPQRHARLPDRFPTDSSTAPVALLPARAGPRARPATRVRAGCRSGRLPVRASRSVVGDELPQRAADDHAERCGLHDCALLAAGREDWDDSAGVVCSG